MATTVSSTQLDFQNIKNNLKAFLAAQSEFSDYNFEASGLNNILDVLAYNTHYNALTANFALNEAFLNTAQLRSSIISHAATLGYETRSKTAAAADITISLDLAGVAGRPTVITLPSGFQFTAKVGDKTFTFQTQQNYLATDDGTGKYDFLNDSGGTSLNIKEGSSVTKNFYVGEVGERQLYVIPDDTMDTSTAIVKVYTTPAATSFVTYTRLADAITVTSDSTYFQITEAPNGYYELNFGDGISFGKSPDPGNKITVEYLSVQGADANGASVFTPTSTLSVNGVGYNLSVSTVSNSLNGADAQSIESIRSNAPIAFAAQQRLVTADDYKAIIQKNFTSVIDATAWGGEDNVPAKYGVVYVSLVFQDGTSDVQKETVKDSIVNNLTNNLSIISIDTEFSDPVNTFLELGVNFNFNPSLTGITIKATESSVRAAIADYFANNLKKFNGVFRKSNLLADIDEISPAILNSRMDVKVQQRFTPTVNVQVSYTVSFPMAIAAPDDENYVIQTSSFIFNNRICTIKNKLGTNVLQILNASSIVEVDNIGSYDADTGQVSFINFIPESIASGESFLKVTVTPANQSTIQPLRNYILDNDVDLSFATGNIDRQTLQSTISAGVTTTAATSSSSSSSGY